MVSGVVVVVVVVVVDDVDVDVNDDLSVITRGEKTHFCHALCIQQAEQEAGGGCRGPPRPLERTCQRACQVLRLEAEGVQPRPVRELVFLFFS